MSDQEHPRVCKDHLAPGTHGYLVGKDECEECEQEVVTTLEMPEIDVSQLKWEATGPEENRGTRLLSSIRVMGCPMHLEAWEVYFDDDGVQQSKAWPGDFSNIAVGIGVEDPWRTVTIDGREYVLIATPFC